MKSTFQSLLAVILLTLPTPALADITLDDFEVGTHSRQTTPWTGDAFYDFETTMGVGTAGDVRLVQQAPQGQSSISFLNTDISNGNLNLEYNDALFQGFAMIHGVYGGTTLPPSGTGEVEDNQLIAMSPTLDLSGEIDITVDYTFDGLANSVIMQIYAFGSPVDGNVFDQSDFIFLQPGTNQASVAIADLFASVDPSQIGGIGISIVALGEGTIELHDFSAVGGTSTAIVTPDSYLVSRGTYVSGGVSELAESDNADLSVTRNSADLLGNIEVEVKGVSPTATPTRLDIDVESAVFARSTVQQFVDYWNYDTGAWEEVASGTATRLSDSVLSATPTGDLSRFVETGTNCIQARVRYSSVVRRQRYSANIDQTVWTIE